MNIQVKEGSFKGKPLLEFWDADATAKPDGKEYPMLSFGIKKARIIMGNLSAIKEFVEAYKEGDESE